MSRPRRLQWELPERPPPKHPYRDTMLVYGAFAVIIVLLAWVTGGGVAKAALVAVIFFAVASAWNVYRWRIRARAAARRNAENGAPGL
jgi:membrane protein implicated in regulation of membrane protease activity